ncbi:Inner membrane protein YejM [Gammaproteobacteria bacterium]|nr:Inner membrane protein YejM [Gammaproteobacteria bacterium]
MDSRRRLLRWIGWFVAANAALYALLGLRYLLLVPWQADALGLVYALLAYVGQFALLAALPAILLLVPLCLLLPLRPLVTGLAVLLAAALATLLVVDGNVFASQRYHLTLLTAMLFEPATWVMVGIIGLLALVFEALLARSVRGWVEARPSRGGRWLALGLVAAWLGGQGIHIWADAIGHLPVTQLTRYLPAYFPIHAKRRLVRLGLVSQAQVDRQIQLQRVGAEGAGQLQYPLHPLRCAAPAGTTPNIVWIIVDALRPDAIDPALTPELAGFRAAGLDFANHWSGGNSSRAGIFSMFYGLPSTYLDAFYGVQQPPVLMQELGRRGYQLGLFAAPGFLSPTDIGRTVFAGLPGLGGETPGVSAVGRNRAVTDDWLAWLGQHDRKQPFFGFLYYDPPMGEMPADAGPLPMDGRFAATPEVQTAWRQYRRSARMVDGEVGRVLRDLRARQLLDDTVVIILSDHGYEFDDNGLGYLGHASDYSPAQLRATLLMHWPGRAPAVYHHRSSHYDLPVTLLKDAFGCSNDPADYALGRDLFAGQNWPWIIAGSYNSHAIVEPGRAIVTHPGGYVEVLGPDYRPIAGARFDPAIVAAALRDMRRFYR